MAEKTNQTIINGNCGTINIYHQSNGEKSQVKRKPLRKYKKRK